MTDEQLMDSYVNGCNDSFSLLTKRWSDKLSRFVGRKVYRPEIAEEIVQEVFFKVYNGRNTWIPNEHKFSSWILTIAKNAIISSNRSKRAKQEVLWIEDKSEEEVSLSEDTVTKLTLLKGINSLPDHLAEAFRLTYIEGMDHREAGEAANVSPDNMRARASRARSALREMLTA
jgi:RNA polymerase sigma-70 factor (ECF subfamily)